MKKDYALVALGALGAFIIWQAFRSRDNRSSSWVNDLRARFGFRQEGAGAVDQPATGAASGAREALERKLLQQRLAQ